MLESPFLSKSQHHNHTEIEPRQGALHHAACSRLLPTSQAAKRLDGARKQTIGSEVASETRQDTPLHRGWTVIGGRPPMKDRSPG